MKNFLLTIAAVTMAFSLSAQNCSDLFISEYIEGDSQNKGVEIYNPTANPISLSGYTLVRFSNGDVYPTDELDLSYVDSVQEIQPYDVIVVVNGQTVENDYGVVDPELYDIADIAGQGEYGLDPNYFNGNDAVAILKNDNLVDLLGKIGEDPGEGWTDADSLDYVAGEYYWLSWTSNHTLIRQATVQQGVTSNPTAFNPAEQWDSLPQNVWQYLGNHECECDPNYDGYPDYYDYTGIGDFSAAPAKTKMAVYPNPAKVNSQVRIMGTENIVSVKVYNILGSLVKTYPIDNKSGNIVIETSGLGKGMYLMRVAFDNHTENTQQLIIE